jgi:hypothetical protein
MNSKICNDAKQVLFRYRLCLSLRMCVCFGIRVPLYSVLFVCGLCLGFVRSFMLFVFLYSYLLFGLCIVFIVTGVLLDLLVSVLVWNCLFSYVEPWKKYRTLEAKGPCVVSFVAFVFVFILAFVFVFAYVFCT